MSHDPASLAAHYTRFRVGERVLLTGHSHQGWPDVAFEAQQRAWLDAAALVDDKWERAAAVADDVRAGWRRLLADPDGEIALGQNTHELVVRLLSAVLPVFGGARAQPLHGEPVRSRRGGSSVPSLDRTKLITTDGEFHTIRRQLDRLAEEGVEVLKIAARPVDTLAERLAVRVDDRTAGVLVSSVLFESAEIVPNLAAVAAATERHGAVFLIDAYHHLNVVPFDVHAMGVTAAFITGGGYKYCQLGEGNCFLRIPPGTHLRPVITGWFTEFGELARAERDGEVRYGTDAQAFAGATYDPTAHYRAAAVFAFHQQMQLTPARLREISRRQVGLLATGFQTLGIDPRVAHVPELPDERRAGFLAIHVPNAAVVVQKLRARRVWTDSRGESLRLGPAPYVTEEQLRAGLEALRECL